MKILEPRHQFDDHRFEFHPSERDAGAQVNAAERQMPVEVRAVGLELARVLEDGLVVNCFRQFPAICARQFAASGASLSGRHGPSGGVQFGEREIRFKETGMMEALVGMDDAAREAFVSQAPIKRAADPSEMAEVVLFLASGAASYLVGSLVRADGALTLR